MLTGQFFAGQGVKCTIPGREEQVRRRLTGELYRRDAAKAAGGDTQSGTGEDGVFL